MIKNRLIAARKEKNMTQNDMAEVICVSQSQYQRRERGEIRISDDEWIRLAKFLGKDISDIKEEDSNTTINNYDNYSGNYAEGDNHFYNIPEYVMKNLIDYIEKLKEENRILNDTIKSMNK